MSRHKQPDNGKGIARVFVRIFTLLGITSSIGAYQHGNNATLSIVMALTGLLVLSMIRD